MARRAAGRPDGAAAQNAAVRHRRDIRYDCRALWPLRDKGLAGPGGQNSKEGNMSRLSFLCKTCGVLALAAGLTCGLVDLGAAAPASGAGMPKPARNVPTKITADHMEYDANKLQVVFRDKVHVDRPDMEIWSEVLTVHFKPANQKASQEPGSAPQGLAAGDVDRLVAEKRVRMKSENRVGTCERATYTPDTGVLVMQGNPRLEDGKNTITGNEIRYYANENRSEVTSAGKQRVEAVFASPESGGKAGRGGR